MKFKEIEIICEKEEEKNKWVKEMKELIEQSMDLLKVNTKKDINSFQTTNNHKKLSIHSETILAGKFNSSHALNRFLTEKDSPRNNSPPMLNENKNDVVDLLNDSPSLSSSRSVTNASYSPSPEMKIEKESVSASSVIDSPPILNRTSPNNLFLYNPNLVDTLSSPETEKLEISDKFHSNDDPIIETNCVPSQPISSPQTPPPVPPKPKKPSLPLVPSPPKKGTSQTDQK